MCGRYYIAPDEEEEDWEEIIAILQRRGETVKTGEIFPSDTVPVIANSRSMRPTPFAMRWGYLLPNGKRVINARSETAADRALFRDGMCQRRCLIPASNYFEWKRKATGKVKYAIRPRQNGLMYMAGIYRVVDGRGEFSILTQAPAAEIRFIHDRMPVIFSKEKAGAWLDLHTPAQALLPEAVREVTFQPAEAKESKNAEDLHPQAKELAVP